MERALDRPRQVALYRELPFWSNYLKTVIQGITGVKGSRPSERTMSGTY
jgi:hypothetical protein